MAMIRVALAGLIFVPLVLPRALRYSKVALSRTLQDDDDRRGGMTL